MLSIEKIDNIILKSVYDYLAGSGEDFKIYVLPDHPTPIELRTHSMEPVPFFLYESAKPKRGVTPFTEATAESTKLYYPDGSQLLSQIIEKASV